MLALDRFSERRLRDSSERSSHLEKLHASCGPSPSAFRRHHCAAHGARKCHTSKTAAWAALFCRSLGDLIVCGLRSDVSEATCADIWWSIWWSIWWYRYLISDSFLIIWWSDPGRVCPFSCFHVVLKPAERGDFLHGATAKWTSWSSSDSEGWCTESPRANYHLNQRDFIGKFNIIT